MKQTCKLNGKNQKMKRNFFIGSATGQLEEKDVKEIE